jgi:crossover junction endodeoxyribonuclease RuvC
VDYFENCGKCGEVLINILRSYNKVMENIILGIDPGYAIVGYGLIKQEGNKLIPIEYGAITTPSDAYFPDRLAHISKELSTIIEAFKPDTMAIEELFFARNTSNALLVAQARGVMLNEANRAKLKIYEYKPNEVKLAVTGYGRADKKQIQEMIRVLLGLKTTPKPDDVADALAIAICHLHSNHIRSKL